MKSVKTLKRNSRIGENKEKQWVKSIDETLLENL